MKRRIIRQTISGSQRSTSTIVFHWNESYDRTAQTTAILEGREPTMADATADFDVPPRYGFTAYAQPAGSSEERKRLRELLKEAGFWQNTSTVPDWTAVEPGEGPVLKLRDLLADADVDSVHYNRVPQPFIVEVSIEGQL